MGLTKRKI